MSRTSPASLWAGLRDGFRTQLWPLPTVSVVLAIALGVGLPKLEAAHSGLVPEGLRTYLFTGGADAARTVLDAVAGSLITVTALTFSLTVVTLQLASSQFSPRLLRTFTRDLVVQATLGLFLGTFAYALTVLRTVRSSAASRAEFVPDLSVTVAYVLAVASVVGLILFLAHLAQTIRVESMLSSVHQDASASLRRELGPAEGVPARPRGTGPERPFDRARRRVVRVSRPHRAGGAARGSRGVRRRRRPRRSSRELAREGHPGRRPLAVRVRGRGPARAQHRRLSRR